MRLGLVQRHAVSDKSDTIRRGLQAMERAARAAGTVVAQQAGSSHADRLFIQHRRPALYAEWFARA